MSATFLTDPTLVLNKNWMPIHVCSVRRALSLVFKGLARVVEPQNYVLYDFESWADLHVLEGEPFVEAVRWRIRIPEVIFLRVCDHLHRPRVVFTRRNLFRRDRNICQYCGMRFATEDLSIDHVVPRSKGGLGTWTNCVLPCLPCNSRKGDRTLRQAGLKLVRQPSEPSPQMAFALHARSRKASWSQFVSEAYWNTELEP